MLAHTTVFPPMRLLICTTFPAKTTGRATIKTRSQYPIFVSDGRVFREIREHPLELERRKLNRCLIGREQCLSAPDAAPLARTELDKWNFAGAPWHEDGLTPLQRWCEQAMQQRELLNGRRNRNGLRENLRGSASPGEALLKHGGAHIVSGATGQPTGRPRKGLAGEQLVAALGPRIPVDELRQAIRSGRHRTDDQWGLLGRFAAFVVFEKPNIRALADALDRGRGAIYVYRRKGLALLNELEREAKLDAIEVSMGEMRSELEEIRTLLGADAVAEAERILSES